MNYHHASGAAKGHHHDHQEGGRGRHLYARSMERAAVNIYRTDNSYEMLVFAPGRIREHFQLEVRGSELVISYAPPENFPRPDWVHREYSRGGFVRSFTLDESVDTGQIQAKYVDGVLQVSLPVIAGKERVSQAIPVS
ncbi:MAG TPA: Hsp20/alpha crystallin family protein [Puia sp.]|nr:Hsp20/alpha crystallin family protein [Puia sp.]